ncbi:FlgN protein [Oxobacter pfennigii]|uniref:FlgN protein n=1 Tax=Oxobacter pfennigii TaxID=36849 RepID=A0A0P8YC14_9CLOT|nr:flagellar protein FlgN [Oxobacter pfennigii]KPU44660.1 FlgN protein [Oxobacter pfennigii]
MELINLLEEEKKCLKDMLDILNEEKAAVISDDMQRLQGAAKKKEELKLKIDDLEITRIQKCGDKTLSEIISLHEGSEKAELETLAADFKDIVKNIQKINDMNRRLINQSLNFVKAAISTAAPSGTSVYGQNGSINKKSTSSAMLDRNI